MYYIVPKLGLLSALLLWGPCIILFLRPQLLPPGPAGLSFQRFVKKGSPEAEQYKGLQGHVAKKEFRQKWAEQKLQEAQQKQQKVTKLVHSELSTGAYMSFKRIWDAEGSGMEGLKAPIM